VAPSPAQAPSRGSRLNWGVWLAWLAWAVVLAATLLLLYRAVLAERQTVDDVFIFLRTARNLADRGEMAFDHGVRVEGTSSPAWTLLLALVWRLGGHGLGVAKLGSLAIAALVPAVCALAVKRAAPDRPLALAIPAVALALDSDLASWASSGMDTPLWTLACVVCVLLAARPSTAAVALGALACVRPEGPLFAVLGVAVLARDRRSLLRLGMLAAAPVVVLTVLRAGYFHALLPNTFWAKMNAADGKDFTGAGYLGSAFMRRPMLVLVLPTAGLLAWRRVRGAFPDQARLALALLLATLLFAWIAGGDWMPGRRLLVPALPLAAIVAAVVLARRPAGLAVATCLVLGAEAGLTFDHAVDQDWRQREWLDERVTRWRPAGHPFRDPYVLDWMPTHLLRQIAPYVAPGDTVAHVDVGELPYVMGDVAFLDGFGLVDRQAGRVAFSPRDPALRAAAAAEFFGANAAVAIMVLDETTGRPFAPAQDAVLADARFAAGWRELGRVPTWGAHPCVTFVRRDLAPRDRATANARVNAWLSRVPDVVALAD
jgi:hypothetical protein